jgi:hypothetical protein
MISFKLLLKFRLGLLWVALAVLLAIPFLTRGYFRKPPLPLPPPKVLTFTSGTPGTPTEMGRQTVTIRVDRPGQYRLVLENANPPWSNYWLQWDYLALKQGDTVIWAIGDDEVPPTYSSEAASELCDPGRSSDCTVTFVVGATKASAFFSDLNDGARPMETVSFTLTDQQTNVDLTLVLSTLNSTHGDPTHFKMKVTLESISQL